MPFAQVLFGVAHASATVKGSVRFGGQTTIVDDSESEDEFGIEAGGGVNVRLHQRVGLRVGASYLRLGASDGGNAARASVGVVIPF